MRISDWSSDVCSSDLWRGSGWPTPASRACTAADCARFPTRGASFPTVATAAAAASPPWPGSHDADPVPGPDRKSVVSGKRVSVRVDLGGRRIIHKQKEHTNILI